MRPHSESDPTKEGLLLSVGSLFSILVGVIDGVSVGTEDSIGGIVSFGFGGCDFDNIPPINKITSITITELTAFDVDFFSISKNTST